MSKLQSIGYINDIKTLPNSNAEVAECTVLCGSDKNGDTQKQYGSFFVSGRTEGLRDVEKALDSSEGKGVMVNLEIKDFFVTASSGSDGKVYANAKGLLTKAYLYTPKNNSQK